MIRFPNGDYEYDFTRLADSFHRRDDAASGACSGRSLEITHDRLERDGVETVHVKRVDEREST